MAQRLWSTKSPGHFRSRLATFRPSDSGHSCATALSPGNQPLPERKQLTNGEECAKDRLVASGQPKRQVYIEVIRPRLCVATRQISQRATAAVCREDRALDQYQASQESHASKLTRGTGEGNRHDASGKEEPNRRVQELYPCEDGNPLRLGFHEKSQFRRLIDSMGGNSGAPQKTCVRGNSARCSRNQVQSVMRSRQAFRTVRVAPRPQPLFSAMGVIRRLRAASGN